MNANDGIQYVLYWCRYCTNNNNNSDEMARESSLSLRT